jgi:hypothetical protein
MQRPNKHIDILEDLMLDEDVRVIAVEKQSADHELGLQDQHLTHLESLPLTITNSAAQHDSYIAIRRVYAVIANVRNKDRVSEGGLPDSWALVVDALTFSDNLWEISQAERNNVSSPIHSHALAASGFCKQATFGPMPSLSRLVATLPKWC